MMNEEKKDYTDADVNILSRTKELLYHHLQNEADSEMLGKIYQDLGQIYQRIKNYPLAHEAWDKALEHFHRVQEPFALAGTYYHQGLLFLEEGDRASALGKWHQVLTILANVSGDGGLLKCQVLYQIGECNLSLGNLQEAKEYLGESIGVAKRGCFVDECARGMQALGRAYRFLGEYNLALRIYLNALRKWKSLDKEVEIGQLVKEIGYVYCEMKDTRKALNAFRYTCRVEEKYNAPGLVETLLMLSKLNLPKDADLAREYCQEAVCLLLQGLGYRFNESKEKVLAEAFYIMGLCCREKNDRKNMLMFLRQSMQIYKKYRMKKEWTEINQVYSKYVQPEDELHYLEAWELVNGLANHEKLRLHKFIG